MDEYRHHVSGFFAHPDEARGAVATLVERGLPRERLHLFDADASPPAPVAKAQSNEVLKDMLVSGGIGTAVGTGIGALAQFAIVAANLSLFVASPLLAPLVMLGWGAGVGGLVGAAAGAVKHDGAQEQEGWFSALVADAIASGQVVLLAETRSAQETAIASEVIKTAVGEFKDVSTV
jgi:hypothetical protein